MAARRPSSAQGIYRRITVRMWGDAKVRALSRPPPCGQVLWIHLLTGEQTDIIPGLCKIGEAAFSEQLGWSLEGFRKAFAEVRALGMVKADWGARVVWVPKAIEHNAPASPNVVRSWADAWDRIPECPLKTEAWGILKAFVEAIGKGFGEAFAEACPKPSPNQEQDQDQEQDAARSPARAREEQPGAESPTATPASARPRPPPPQDDDVPARRLLVADVTELPEPAASVRAQIEQRLGYQCDLAEGFAEEVARLGEDRALEVFGQAATEYIERTGGSRIQSLAFFVQAAKRFHAPGVRPPGPCREWDAILSAIRNLPPGSALPAESIERWLEPLSPRLDDGTLRLVAPDPEHALFVAEHYVTGLRRIAAATLGGTMPIEIEPRAAAKAASAPGGAP